MELTDQIPLMFSAIYLGQVLTVVQVDRSILDRKSIILAAWAGCWGVFLALTGDVIPGAVFIAASLIVGVSKLTETAVTR